MAGKEPIGSACAPPSGSLMMSSITPNLTSSWAVMRSASVACTTALHQAQSLDSHGLTQFLQASKPASACQPQGTAVRS